MTKKKWIITFLLTLTLFLTGALPTVFAQCGNESECNDLIRQYTEQVTKLQGQGKTLSNQIAQFDAQIKLATLKIIQTEEKILLLGGRIDQLESSLDSLSKAFEGRAVETYKLSKVENGFIFLLTSKDLEDAVSRFHYLQKIQEADRSLLEKLQEAQTTYVGEKVDQEELQKELNKQKANLNSQKAAKANLLAVTKNDEKKYQTLLAQVNAQLSKFRNFVNSRGGSSILDGQTKCNEGWTGCYYNQRDSLWGNLFLGSSGYLMKDSGCFATSVAMLASHVGKNIKPNDIASSPDAITPGGDVVHSFKVNNITVSINVDSKDKLDQYLSSGQPVMAGLNGNSHFIVILRKEGDNYIMNDPFLKDGYNKPLSAGGYTFSSITGLRLVTFN